MKYSQSNSKKSVLKAVAPTLLTAVFIVLFAASALSSSLASALTPVGGTNAAILPTTLGSMGDSISMAANVTSSGGNSALSWTTGTDTRVTSIKQRIAAKRGTTVNARVGAVSGTDSSSLVSQANYVIAGNAGATTILMGANDACADTIDGMTSTATFQSNVSSALTLLDNAGVKVVYASIPDLSTLWNNAKDTSAARSAWSKNNVCADMLSNPLSMAQADVDRRAAVTQRINDYNAIIASECALRAGCSYDNGALHGIQFAVSDLSPIDYFHPSITGQNKVADAVWPAFVAIYPSVFDVTAPTSIITSPSTNTTVSGTVLLHATADDNVGVTRVQILSGDGSSYLGTATYKNNEWVYSFGTVTVANGTYSFKTRAYDAAGNIGFSAPITITINNPAKK